MNKTEEKDIIIYQNSVKGKIEVTLEKETVWLTQKQMSTLFNKDVRTINEHIQNIYHEKELGKSSTIRKYRIVQIEGKRKVQRSVDHYNLDVIISIGYRVKSKQGTQFRIWASKILKDYLIKGYSLNEKRLNQKVKNLEKLQKTISLLQRVVDKKYLPNKETIRQLFFKKVPEKLKYYFIMRRYEIHCLN